MFRIYNYFFMSCCSGIAQTLYDNLVPKIVVFMQGRQISFCANRPYVLAPILKKIYVIHKDLGVLKIKKNNNNFIIDMMNFR